METEGVTLYVDIIELDTTTESVETTTGSEDSSDVSEEWLWLEINGTDEVRIYGYMGGDSDIVIPNKIQGKVVDAIDAIAFEKMERIENVIISEGITSIGAGAFRNCPNLQSVTIPESVTTIEYEAFKNCSSLTSVEFLGQVTSIEENVFEGCSNLESITIPESVESIESRAFADCSSLTNITIPENVTTIDASAFYGCSGLISVIIESTYIHNPTELFVDSDNLISITTSQGKMTHKLIWSDEFDGDSLDISTWSYETGNGVNGWGNKELQNYTALENVKFEDGNLVIIPKMEYNTATGEVTNCTSTRIMSKNKKEMQYGEIEIRAKAAGGEGTWSAGWMLGTNGKTWPSCGEIDILESMPLAVTQSIQCTFHNNTQGSLGGNLNYSTGLTREQTAKEYHTYGIIWDENTIQFTVDGKVTGIYDPREYVEDKITLDTTWECFQYPFYFILNSAIGGNSVGEVTPEGWTLVEQEGDI